MPDIKRVLAFAAAALMLSCGTAGSLPLRADEYNDNTQLRNLIRSLAALPAPAEPFETLTYDTAEQQLYCDGTAVGQHYGGFSVQDGKLTVSAESLGISGAGQDAFSPADAASLAGLEYTEQDGKVTVRAPFSGSRLIVKSGKTPQHDSAVSVTDYGDLHFLQYASPADAYSAYQQYCADSSIRSVQPDRIYHTDAAVGAISDDDLDRMTCDMGFVEYNRWLQSEKETLPEVKVAVLDTGIYAEHNWFAGRLAEGGISLMTTDSVEPEDAFGHGTHCAGILAQATPENVKILPVKVMNDRGYGYGTVIYCGMLYAIEQHADVVSMSLGGNGEDWLIDEGVAALTAADIPCIAAAGNESDDAKYHHPARNPDCVTVSSVTAQGGEHGEHVYERSHFSNYGDAVDFCAGGDSVESAYIGGRDQTAVMSGTSMATPFVAAAYADMLSYDPMLTGKQLYAYLKANVTDLGEAGFDPDFGWGYVNMAEFRFTENLCKPPVITPEKEQSDGAVTVTLTADDPDAEIYYTLDGSYPSAESFRYTEPFVLSETAQIRCAACVDGIFSRTASKWYMIGGKDTADAIAFEDGVLLRYNGRKETLDLAELYPDGSLKEIGRGAFVNTPVKKVILPDSVTKIRANAFLLTGLTEIQANGVTEIEEGVFCFAADLKSASFGMLRSIGDEAFRACENLSELNFTPDAALTEIPSNAFRNCAALKDIPLKWEQITKIGDQAFAYAGLRCEISLPALEMLGESAFEASDITALTLPDTITALPDCVLLQTSSLQKLSAPGVTEIGMRALAMSGTDALAACDIDFSKVTSLGDEALVGIRFDAPVTFSALKSLGKGAFNQAIGAAVTLPQIKTARKDAFRYCAADLYLPALETADDYGFSGCTGKIITGDSLSTIAPYAFDDCACLAGPADSPLADYARTNDIPFLATPAVYPQGSAEQTVLPGAKAVLTVSTAGADGMTLRWYRVSGETETEISGASGLTCCPPTDTEGVFRYRAALYDGGRRCGAADFTLTVKAENLLQMQAEQTAVLLDWSALRSDSDSEQRSSYTVAFKPPHAGDYRVTLAYYDNKDNPPEILCAGSTAGTVNLAADRRKGDTVTLDADTTCLVSVRVPAEIKGADCSVLYVEPAEQTYESLAGSRIRYVTPEPYVLFYDPAKGSPQIESLTACVDASSGGETRTLTSGKDFLFAAERLNNGRYRMYLYPIGAYTNLLPLTSEVSVYPLNGTAKTGSNLIRKVDAETETAALTFVPEKDGIYTFAPDIREDLRERELQSGVYRASFWQCPAVVIADQAGNKLDEEVANHPAEAELKAGETYYICLYRVRADFQYVLQIAQETDDAWLSVQGRSLYVWDADDLAYTGKPVIPETEFSAGDLKLENGKDYDTYFLSNDARGTMAAVAVGKGGYRGFCITECPLTETIKAGFSCTLPKRQTKCYFSFTPEEDGVYIFDMDMPDVPETTEGSLSAWIYPQDNEKAIAAAVADAAHYQDYSAHMRAELKAGETYIFFLRKEIEGDMQIRLVRGETIFGSRIHPQMMAYADPDGSCKPPAVTITRSEETELTEGTDYTLSVSYADDGETAVIAAHGIGGYVGRTSVRMPVAKPLSAVDTLMDVPSLHDSKRAHFFYFIPTESGRYSFRTAPAEAPLRAVMESGIYEEAAAAETQTYLSVYHGITTLGDYISSRAKYFGTQYLELEAGELYCVELSDEGGAEACSLIVLKEKKLLRDLRAEYEKQYPFYQIPVEPELHLFDGKTELVKGVDYRIALTDDWYFVAEGIGKYCGHCLFPFMISADMCGPIPGGTRTKVRLDEPFQHSCEGYVFYLDYDTRLTLQADAEDSVSGQIFDLSRQNPTSSIDTDSEAELEAGTYMFVPDPEPESMPHKQVTLTLKTEAVSVYMADAVSIDACYTGSAVTPHASVRLGDKELTEGTDFRILTDGALTETGSYRLTIEGIGKYYDTQTVTFRILPQDSEELPLLTEGSHAPQIPADGQPVIYRWIPTEASYCFSRTDNRPGSIQVYDAEGALAGALKGIGPQETEIKVEPGAEYRVVLAMESPKMTGAFIFSVTSDYRMLDTCTVQMPARITTALSDGIPAYTLFDGEQKLQSGVDYELFAAGGEKQPGIAVLSFRGIGRYHGMLEQEYEICPASLAETPADISGSYHLPENRIVPVQRLQPGTMQLFLFTAPETCVYKLTLPQIEEDGACAFLYDEAGNLLEAGLTEIRLQKAETLRILCVTAMLTNGFEDVDFYPVGVSGVHWEAEGITYTMTDEETVIVSDAVRDAQGGIHIPNLVMIPETGMIADVSGLDEALCAEIADTHTIYGERGSRLEKYCLENGLCFASEELTDPAAGDLTGDGAADRSDLLTLNRILSECSGMTLNAAVMQAADLNADGMLDMTDLRLLKALTKTDTQP